MLMCESQAYSYYTDRARECEVSVYPLEDGGRYLSFSTDSDNGSGYSPSSSVSEHWEYLSGVETEDDVFTEREVVLSYDGCEVSENVAEIEYEEITYPETFSDDCSNRLKKEVEEDDVTMFPNEIPFSIDENDVKNININEINCTDSFLEWLDSEQDLASPQCYTESDDSIGNENESIDLQTDYSQETFSPSSDYINNNTNESQETTCLPPIQTMIPAGSKIIHSFPTEKCLQAREAFNSLIRGSPTSLHVDLTVDGVVENRGGYGHLLCKDDRNENDYTSYYTSFPENQVVIRQSKGELIEKLRQRDPDRIQTAFHQAHKTQTDKCLLECRWENCWAVFVGQAALVRHIEKTHVELRRSDEFACLWQDCPRRTRPFNARYKLLIHMRVHSGEKPNKCPFPGCLKAFSRLENLKIHQRSHTGERPYSCQFPSCAKAFSNSSDRAKHQRTHYDTKPYACQVPGCRKRYTDPSSLRKHIKNHTGATICKTKKLIASEPVVTISNIEQRQRERLQSFVSETTTSDYQDWEYNLTDQIEEISDSETLDYEAIEPQPSTRLTDLENLDNEIESNFFDGTYFEDSNLLTFADEEMLNLLNK